MEHYFIYLSDCTCDELFYSVRFCKGVSLNAAYCAGCTAVWYFHSALCCCFRIWRRILQRALSNESGSFNQFGPCKCRIWQMGEMERKISVDESDSDQWNADYWNGDWILNLDVCGS